MASGIRQPRADPHCLHASTPCTYMLQNRIRRTCDERQDSISSSETPARCSYGHVSGSRCKIRCRAIIPFVGFLPGPFMLACVMWTIGAIRFWQRFDRTSYMRQSKVALTALWPILFVGSPKFRQEFKKAVVAAREG